MRRKIKIIGGGINGLSVALKLAENYDHRDVEITVISEKFSPHTTGDVAAGLWGPYLLGSTPDSDVLKWSSETHVFFHDLWKNGLANECGVSLLPTYEMSSEDCEEPDWKDVVFGYQKISKDYLKKLGDEHGKTYKFGIHYITFTCEPTKLMKFLHRRLEILGVKFEQRLIENINEFCPPNCDLLINCTGIGSKLLLKDYELEPIRGQVVKIEAPWVYHVLTADKNYIIPNTESVVLGGTGQRGDCNVEVVAEDKAFIVNGCHAMMPSLKNAKLIADKVGLRPSRSCVRLEAVQHETSPGKLLNIIHNYGHGGSGVTLAWGCASDVLRMSAQIIKLNSKL